jgi:hypothetical protein
MKLFFQEKCFQLFGSYEKSANIFLGLNTLLVHEFSVFLNLVPKFSFVWGT